MNAVTPSRQLAAAQVARSPQGFWSAVVVFLLGTWLGAGVLQAQQPALGLSPDLLVLAQLGPSVGVLAVVQFRRRRGQPTMVAASLRPTAAVLRRIAAGTGVIGVVLGISVVVLTVMGHSVPVRAPGQLGASLWWLPPLQLGGGVRRGTGLARLPPAACADPLVGHGCRARGGDAGGRLAR